MLTSSQLAIAISAILAGAVVVGWILHWLWARAINPAGGAAGRISEMVESLHQSDKARHEAEEARIVAETELATQQDAFQTELATMQTRLDGAIEGREAALTHELQQARDEATAAMTGLGNARRRIADLEARLDAFEADSTAQSSD